MEKKVKKLLLVSIFLVMIFLVLMVNVSAAVSLCRSSELVKVFCKGMGCHPLWESVESETACQYEMWGGPPYANYCYDNGFYPIATTTHKGSSKACRFAKTITGCGLLYRNRKCWGICSKGEEYAYRTTKYNHMFIKTKINDTDMIPDAQTCYNSILCDSGWTEYIKWHDHVKISPGGDRYHCVRVCVKCEDGYVNVDNNWDNGCEPATGCDAVCYAACRQRPYLPTGCHTPMMGWPHPFCESSCKCHCRHTPEDGCILNYAEDCAAQGGICREIGNGAECQTFGIEHCSGSCQVCQNVLDDMPDNHILMIDSDISAPFGGYGKYCLSFGGTNKTIDCGDNWITGGEGRVTGIFVLGTGHTIQNCKIKSFYGESDGIWRGGRGIQTVYGVNINIKNIEITDIKGKSKYIPPEEPPIQYSSNNNFYPELEFQGGGSWEHYPGAGIEILANTGPTFIGAYLSDVNIHNNEWYGLYLRQGEVSVTNSRFCFNSQFDIKKDAGSVKYHSGLTCDQNKVPAGVTCEEPCGLPGECVVNSISVTPDCEGGSSPACELGEEIMISISYSGTECPTPSYIQVDANSTGDPLGEKCTIAWKSPPASIKGMETTCTSSPCTENWVINIPSIPSECLGKTVYAWAVGLYDDPSYTPGHHVTGNTTTIPYPSYGHFTFAEEEIPPTECKIIDADVKTYCGTEGCDNGDKVELNITVEDMSKCEALNVNKMQIDAFSDAQSQPTGMVIGGGALCNVYMVNSSVIKQGDTYLGNWTVIVPQGCQGETVDANIAKVFNNTGQIAQKFGNFGSFDFVDEPTNWYVLEDISVSPSVFVLNITDTQQLEVIALMKWVKNNSFFTLDVTQQADYISNDTSVASVSALGLVTGIGDGTGKITAEYTHSEVTKEDSSIVNVRYFEDDYIRYINLALNKYEIEINEETSYEVKAYWSNGLTTDITSESDVQSLNPNVASVNQNTHRVKGEDEGIAIINASYIHNNLPYGDEKFIIVTGEAVGEYNLSVDTCGDTSIPPDGDCEDFINVKGEITVNQESWGIAPQERFPLPSDNYRVSFGPLQDWYEPGEMSVFLPPNVSLMGIYTKEPVEYALIIVQAKDEQTGQFINALINLYLEDDLVNSTINDVRYNYSETYPIEFTAEFEDQSGYITPSNLTITIYGNGIYFFTVYYEKEAVGECFCEPKHVPCGFCYDFYSECDGPPQGPGQIIPCSPGWICNYVTGKCQPTSTQDECHDNATTCNIITGCYWDYPDIPPPYCKHCQTEGPETCSGYDNQGTCNLDPCVVKNVGCPSGASDCRCEWETDECILKYQQQTNGDFCEITLRQGTCEEGCQGKINYRWQNYTCDPGSCSEQACVDLTYPPPDYTKSECVICPTPFRELPFFSWWNILAVVSVLIVFYIFMLRKKRINY
ncbi:MAG: Ig-like domain-containing protein [Candidatus Pacearchaeota archaeon]|nr:MAG: Ig-like domain-containing protein [Candidatus Pacearchaeota archaeon]